MKRHLLTLLTTVCMVSLSTGRVLYASTKPGAGEVNKAKHQAAIKQNFKIKQGRVVAFPDSAPRIQYSKPNPIVFTQNMLAPKLTPVNTGGRIPANYLQVYTLAGSTQGDANGPAADARFYQPAAVAADAAGNVYVADTYNNKIKKITPAGEVTTFAGTGVAGAANGPGSTATFKNPFGIVVDHNGNVYVGDSGNNQVRKITPAGVVSTFAGNSTAGLVNGNGVLASFNQPQGLAVDVSNDIFVADTRNHAIRRISPGGVVTTFAGSGVAGSADGTGTAASFNNPTGLAVDNAGNMYVADYGNNEIRRITAHVATVVTMAGNLTKGYKDDRGAAASFSGPKSIAVDESNLNLYVTDCGNNTIRMVTQKHDVTTVAGVMPTGASTHPGNVNGAGLSAKFNTPVGIAFDPMGSLIIADYRNNAVRKITRTGYTISAQLPYGLIFDTSTGNITGIPYTLSPATDYSVIAVNKYGISKVNLNIAIVTTLAPPKLSFPGGPVVFYVKTPIKNNVGPTNTGGSVPGILYGQVSEIYHQGYMFGQPYGITINKAGGGWIADAQNNNIRKLPGSGGADSTLAGNYTAGATNGPGASATFNHPTDVALDKWGNVFVADEGNNLIRKITPAGIVSTFAGSGAAGFADGIGTAAQFWRPNFLIVDTIGNVFVSDTYNNRIRKITPDGTVTTFAGSGTAGAANGTGTSASFNHPMQIIIDPAGNLFVADQLNNIIRKISAAGVVKTFSGNGVAGYAVGAAGSSSYNSPVGLALDALGNIYVADQNTLSIRKLTSSGFSTNFQIVNYGYTGIEAYNLGNPVSLAYVPDGTLFVSQLGNRQITTAAAVGYEVKGVMPPGLQFGLNPYSSDPDPYNGANSYFEFYGTPKAARAPRNITISGYNLAGSSTTALNVSVAAVDPVISYPGAPFTFTKSMPVTPITPVNTGAPIPNIPYGSVTTLAGSGYPSSANGSGAAAGFNRIEGLTIDPDGNLYAADYFSNSVRRITPAGVVTTVAKTTDFGNPKDLLFDDANNLYIVGQTGNKISKQTPEGTISTFAGSGVAGYGNGFGPVAKFASPGGMIIKSDGSMFIADTHNHRIRTIAAGTQNVTSYIGNGTSVTKDGYDSDISFENPVAILNDTTDLNFFVCDANVIRKIYTDPAFPDIYAYTFAGTGAAGAANGAAGVASFNAPQGMAKDALGNIYIGDTGNNLIRKITRSGYTGVVTTLAGNGTTGTDDGVGAAAAIAAPMGMAIDDDGNLYVGDGNFKIRKIITTGYAIAPALPAGLSFDAATGTISGTPTVTSPAKTYVVTALAATGSRRLAVEIGVQEPSMFMANSLQDTPIVGEPKVSQSLSPNGDGNNDVLAIENIEQYPDNNIIIMTAGGAKVYEAVGYGTGGKVFNGHSSVSGKLQTAGSYFYQLEYKADGEVKRKTGYFVIKY